MADKLVEVAAGQRSSLEKRRKKIKKVRALSVKQLNESTKNNDVEPSTKKVSVQLSIYTPADS